MSKEYLHKDRLGRTIQSGDCVAAPHHNGLMISIIKKCSPKMIQVTEVGKKSTWRSKNHYNKYPNEVVKLDGPEVTMYLLQRDSDST